MTISKSSLELFVATFFAISSIVFVAWIVSEILWLARDKKDGGK